MIVLLLALLTAAWGQAPDPLALARQEALVATLASEAAQARDGGASRQIVAETMAAYRVEAEALAGMRADSERGARDAEARAREVAVAALERALAEGRASSSERAILADWLDPLSGQLGILEAALAAARPQVREPIGRDLVIDVAARAQLLTLVATYDAARARAEADQAELRARGLRARANSGVSGGMGEVLQARALEEQVAARRADAAGSEAIAEGARGIHEAAITALESEP